LKGEDHLGVDRRIILEMNLNRVWRCGLDSNDPLGLSLLGPVTRSVNTTVNIWVS
jgi:hypothetical protein